MYQDEINKKNSEILECRSLLKATDYHVIKDAEGGYTVPLEIKQARITARENINRLESEIGDLELLQEEYQNTIEGMEL